MSTSILTFLGAGTHASRPAANTVGSGACGIYYETDTGNTCLTDNSTWHVISTTSAAIVQLDKQELTSGAAANITFSSIPSGYRDLLVVLTARGTANAGGSYMDVYWQANGDTGAHYDYWNLYAQAALAKGSGTGATSAFAGWIAGSSASANVPGVLELKFPEYTNANWYKACLGNHGEAGGAAGNAIVGTVEGHWRDTSAITSLVLFPSSGNFAQHSIATLYGIGS